DLVIFQAQEKGIQLNFHINGNVPRQLIGDPLKLSQLVMNLVSNAIKFTEKGEVILNCTCNEQEIKKEQDSIRLQFSVTDTGIGMSADQVKNLFQPFTQADGSITRKYGGTGLGLTICKKYAEMLGGNIQVESKPGKGSRFTFDIKLGLPSKIENAPGNENLNKSLQNIDQIRNANILVVEDNKANRFVAKELLEKYGFNVTLANNGKQALNYLLADQEKRLMSKFDAVLMDLQMPVMDGIQAAIKIRKNEKFDNLPIIAMTANVLPEERERCFDAGMNDYLTKPIDHVVFLKTLVRWIKLEKHPVPNIKTIAEIPKKTKIYTETHLELPEKIPGINIKAALKRFSD
ncbi:ATP-binding protein, partial [Desulfobacterales bacterium HSG17]|nr:ATP-binding protein [Desulfobacterales bacterium HSG17]